MTDNTEPKTRTITLTGRAPVKIREDEWPQIAHGSYRDHDNQYEFQANRTWKCDIRVRQHPDGRAIVYGVYDYDTAFQNERNFVARAGVLLDGASVSSRIPDAISAVASTLIAAAEEAGHNFRSHISACERECISDLPAVEL